MLGIFLDTETNGLNPNRHKIIEIAYKILDVNTAELQADFQAVILHSKEDWEKSDPESLKINGFTWDELSHGDAKEEVASRIVVQFQQLGIKRGGAVFICQNPSFDRAYFSQLIDVDTQEKLFWPYHWLDLASMYWARTIDQAKFDPKWLPWKTGLSKDKIAAACHLPPENKPHRAINGVNHLILCYEAIVGFPQCTAN
ncbi:MAG: exonuclease domain-containing protein [Anaerolineae bacterium]